MLISLLPELKIMLKIYIKSIYDKIWLLKLVLLLIWIYHIFNKYIFIFNFNMQRIKSYCHLSPTTPKKQINNKLKSSTNLFTTSKK